MFLFANVNFSRHLQNLVDKRQIFPFINNYYYYSRKGQKRILTLDFFLE